MVPPLSRTEVTATPEAANSIRLKPPNAAAYWSCQPPAMPRSFRSIV
jgi:hypothetical protein